MSNAKHTPGPWSVTRGHYPGFLYIRGASFGIPVVTHANDLDSKDTLARTADAHLIAAAPDLLEALEPFVRFNSSEPTVTVELSSADIARARAAIAKATGTC